MENDIAEQARLEQLHRLYYNLQHRILPEIILSEQVDNLLNPNPAGEGLLSEAGTTEPIHVVEQAIADEELQNHIAEQEERRSELEAIDFEDEAPDFLRDLEREDYDIANEDFFEEDGALESDDKDFADDMFEDDLNPDEGDEDPPGEMLQLMAELDEMLELHKVKADSSSNPDENFLEDTWLKAWFDTTFEQIPDRAGYTMKRINQQGYEIVLFTFPEPFQIPDAWMAAAIRKPGKPYRYFTLECTVSEEEETAVLAEWKAGGAHRNSGTQTTDVTNTKSFLEMIINDLNYSF